MNVKIRVMQRIVIYKCIFVNFILEFIIFCLARIIRDEIHKVKIIRGLDRWSIKRC